MHLGRTPRIVGCVATAAALRRVARTLPADCDWVEVRLDLIGPDLADWVDRCAALRRQGMPVLLTIRHAREGGAWRGSEADRLALYRAGLPAVSAVDMEIGSPGLAELAQAASARRVRVVGSFHDFNKTPSMEKLLGLEARGRRLGADVVKIAAQVRGSADLARLFALPAQAQGPVCVLGMGARGAISRVALPCAGSCLAYGALGRPTAPGQMTCRELARALVRWGVREA